MKTHAQINAYLNVAYQLRDSEGNIQRLFQVNGFGKWLLEFFRRHDFGEYFRMYGLRIPHLTGQWTNTMMVRNLMTSAGKASMAARIGGAAGDAAFTYIALGTGTTAAAAADTALQTEITTGGAARVNVTPTRVSTSVTNDTSQWQTTFIITASFSVTESGILNAASGGTLLAHQVFTAISIQNGYNFTVTWKVQFS